MSGLHDMLRVRDVIDVRHHQSIRPPVQHVKDQIGMGCAHAHDPAHRHSTSGLKLRQQRRLGAAAMLEVKQQPVETGFCGEFSDDR